MSLISRNVRRSACVAVAAGALLTMAACGSSSNNSDTAATGAATGGATGGTSAPAKMTLWTNATTGPGISYFKDAIAAFDKANPGDTITLQSIQNEDYDGKLQTALQAGQGSAPDIFFQRGGGKMQAMAQAGQLADLSSDVSADVKSISPGTASIFQVDGKTYGVPLDVTPSGFWYSKDLFKKAGITGTPTTIDELNADVTKLKAAGITPIGVGGKDGWPAAHYYYWFIIRQCSQSVLNSTASALQSGSGGFSDGCFLQAAKDLQAFNATKPFQPDPFNTSAQTGAGSSAGQLANHQVAMELQGAWEPGVVGSLTPNQKPLPDLGFFPFPKVTTGNPQGDPSAVMAGSDGYSCSAWAPEPACANFLNFLATPAQQAKYATAFAVIPANPTAQKSTSDPALKDALDATNKAKYVVLFLDTLYGENVGNALNTAVVNLMSGSSNDPQSIIDAVNNTSSKG